MRGMRSQSSRLRARCLIVCGMLTQRNQPTAHPLEEETAAVQQFRTGADQPLDLAVFQALCADDSAFQAELIETFLTHSQHTVDEVHRALTGLDAAALRQAAHSLKGAASEIGAEPLRCAAAQLEEAAREGRVDASVAALGQVLSTEFARVAAVLRGTLAKL